MTGRQPSNTPPTVNQNPKEKTTILLNPIETPDLTIPENLLQLAFATVMNQTPPGAAFLGDTSAGEALNAIHATPVATNASLDTVLTAVSDTQVPCPP